MTDYSTQTVIALNLYRWRSLAGISQGDLARIAGLREETVARCEQASHKNGPSDATISALEHALDRHLEDEEAGCDERVNLRRGTDQYLGSLYLPSIHRSSGRRPAYPVAFVHETTHLRDDVVELDLTWLQRRRTGEQGYSIVNEWYERLRSVRSRSRKTAVGLVESQRDIAVATESEDGTIVGAVYVGAVIESCNRRGDKIRFSYCRHLATALYETLVRKEEISARCDSLRKSIAHAQASLDKLEREDEDLAVSLNDQHVDDFILPWAIGARS